jgi:4-aminobutyrate--pyruvate transaminase
MNSIESIAAVGAASSTLHGFANLRALQQSASLKLIKGGRGVWVYDEAGRPLLEAASGMWCASLGFGDPELVEAAIEQFKILPYYHTLGGKSVVPSEVLSERLLAKSPVGKGKVYFACTGSEGNDFLVKFVRYANNAAGLSKKKKFISRTNGYHGATLAASSLTGIVGNHKGFDLPLPGFLHTADPHYYRNALPGESEDDFCRRMVRELRTLIESEGPETIAGFLAEPVGGAGGVVIPASGYYTRVQELLQSFGIPFFSDEVITGVGRLGDWFGSDTMGIKPRAIVMGKGLTSAYFPLSAIILEQDLVDRITEGSDRNDHYFAHGATYAGHPVGCAIALAVLDIIERRNILDHVRCMAEVFKRRLLALQEHPLVGHARCVGLVGAVELRPASGAAGDPGDELVKKVHAIAENRYGLIFRKLANNVCAFSPPLVITEEEINELFDRFTAALDSAMAS